MTAMYHPYFRGKQFELLVIRETAGLLAACKFVPIIEPVKEALSGLERTLKTICEAKGKAVIIVNPSYGVYSEGGQSISSLMKTQFENNELVDVGVLLKQGMSLVDALAFYDQHPNHTITFVHAGFTQAKALADRLGENLKETRHVFIDDEGGTLYRNHFRGCERVLLKDGYTSRRNSDHPDVEFFSELHITFEDLSMDGFGDFSIVGDDYAEGGGPAYTVAIHLTFIDPDNDNAMYLYHFKSDRQDTPTDPAGKFLEALEKLIRKLNSPNHKLFESSAIKEFQDLYTRRHFPGLGYIKKLAMKHHIETLAHYLT